MREEEEEGGGGGVRVDRLVTGTILAPNRFKLLHFLHTLAITNTGWCFEILFRSVDTPFLAA